MERGVLNDPGLRSASTPLLSKSQSPWKGENLSDDPAALVLPVRSMDQRHQHHLRDLPEVLTPGPPPSPSELERAFEQDRQALHQHSKVCNAFF